MSEKIYYINPSGNITAIIPTNLSWSEKETLASEIIKEGKAEQVAYESKPLYGGIARIDMMGGEFCGNALRGYGYKCIKETYDIGRHNINVEISGSNMIHKVTVDLDCNKSYVQVEKPYNIRNIKINDEELTLVQMDGIDHLIVDDITEDELLAKKYIEVVKNDKTKALGVMFVNGNRLVPYVYVAGIDTFVRESACGSGSIATAYYLYQTGKNKCKSYIFEEPGGNIEVVIKATGTELEALVMGGDVAVYR